VVEGTLYPLLTRLKNDGLLDYSWRESVSGPPRKYFKVSELGKNFLESLTKSWQQLVQSVNQTIAVTPKAVNAKEVEHDLLTTPIVMGSSPSPLEHEAPESPYFAS
jgi:DNA-binding PadR family transcriptional regulator